MLTNTLLQIRHQYNVWMAEAVKDLTPSGNIKKPLYETIVRWIKVSWDAIDINMIKKSFKCCGISNKRDGSEDSLIFDYDSVLGSTSSDRNDIIIIEEEANTVDNANVGDVRDMVENDYYLANTTDFVNCWNN